MSDRTTLLQLCNKGYWSAQDTEVLSEAIPKIVDEVTALDAQLAELRSALQVAADRLSTLDDVRPDVWSRFWFTSWRNESRRHAEALLRITKLEKWLRESGEEASRLQTKLSIADEEIGALTRALDLARAGERCTEVD